MRLIFRFLIAFLLISSYSFSQTGTQQTQGDPNQQQPPLNPRNAPSTTGFLQQAINENASTLSLLGINPIAAQSLVSTVVPAQQMSVPTTTNTVTNQTISQPVTVLPPDTLRTIFVDTIRLPKSSLFGYESFRNKTLQIYERSYDAIAAENYIIGLGDQLSVNIWGYSSFSGSFTVDQTGAIYPSGTGKIYVKGLTLSQARGTIRSRFASYLDLANSQIEVTIVYSRNIKVNIVGEVFSPGTFTIPAVNTVFNALIAAQGPTDQGSLRKIYVKRQGETVKTLDVYQFLLNPQSNEDYYLQENDYIFVPPIGKTVGITGEINRPYRYELIEGEDLITLISYAGGLTPYSYQKAIQIRRYVDQKLSILDLNLDSLIKAKGKFELLNGDEIFIGTIPDQLVKFVKVSGAVISAGDYNFSPGLRISDLIRKAGLREDALTTRGYVIRRNDNYTSSYIPFIPQNILDNSAAADNLALQNTDEIYFYSKNDYVDQLKVNAQGAVRIPGAYVFAEGMTLSDLLLTAGGLTPEASNTKIEISRYQSTANGIPTPQVIRTVTIADDLSINGEDQSFALEPFDIVFVRSLVNYSNQDLVIINGEVLYPGSYAMTDKLEKIADLLQRAGGITNWAELERSTLVRREEQKGIIFMNLHKALKDPDSRHNFILRPGDEVYIPLRTDLISIAGFINYPYSDTITSLNAPYHKGRRAKFYIKHYGLGFHKDSKRGHTYVVQPGNIVQDPRHWGFIQIYPKVKNGATVVVPFPPIENDLKAEVAAAIPLDVNAMIESITVKITGILTIALLLSRVGTF